MLFKVNAVPFSFPRGCMSGHSRRLAARFFAGVWPLGMTVACTSLVMSLWTAHKFGASLACFHDEFSYLLQAETFLRGRLCFVSHPTIPDLFDQLHVLNEGKFASRYFPGTAAWIGPFVAIGRPHWAQWLAGMLIAVATFAAGREWCGNLCGFVAGLVIALSPGMAIFSNLLLSNHPTTLGLAVFVFAFIRTMNAESFRWALLGGTGLAFAILCRPLTAAAVAAPFMVVFALRGLPGNSALGRTSMQGAARGPPRSGSGTAQPLSDGRGWIEVRSGADRPAHGRAWVRMAVCATLPIVSAVAIVLLYNHEIAGNAWKSLWQLYNEIYTPRHVYGFNNGMRGEAGQGPKVIREYDRWAKNLTVDLALENSALRLTQSWRWTLGAIPLTMAAVVVLLCPGPRRMGWLLLASIASLHAAYFPYWYAGTLGFHYVFETMPLWALVFGLATAQLFRTWHKEGQYLLCPWWASVAVVGLAAMFLPVNGNESAIDAEIAQMVGRRAGHARFLKLVAEQVRLKPALVLIDQGFVESFIVNSAGLDSPIIFGRYRPAIHSVAEIADAFPERSIYLFDASAWQVEQVDVSRRKAEK